MTKSNNKSKQIIETILIVVIVLSVGLIAMELGANVSAELASQEQKTMIVEEVNPTAVPTLTAEERQELFSAPVGEEGLD